MSSAYQRAVAQYRRDELDKQVLAAIQQHIQAHGYAPSIRDICATTENNSTSQITRSLHRLTQNGKIKRAENTARAIVLLEDANHA